MSFDAAPWLGRCALLLLMLVGLLGGGCSPDAFLTPDEDRERNFQRAREAERLGDYEGAADFYERAIEKNPRSAAVHLGYASLCEGPLRRHADAVYHYQQYLKLRAGDPKDPKAVTIRQRITNCTEQLAMSVPLVIRSETIARDLAAVRGENLVLRGQVTQLQSSVAHWSNEWSRTSLMLQQARVAGVAGGGVTGGGTASPGRATASAERSKSLRGNAVTQGRPVTLPDRSARPVAGGARPVSSYRTHRVGPGETMEGVARRYGTTSAALKSANPKVRPRSMPVGTILRIPDR
jgi:LysM repeat protein